jgi:hypothetical protein
MIYNKITVIITAIQIINIIKVDELYIFVFSLYNIVGISVTKLVGLNVLLVWINGGDTYIELIEANVVEFEFSCSDVTTKFCVNIPLDTAFDKVVDKDEYNDCGFFKYTLYFPCSIILVFVVTNKL